MLKFNPQHLNFLTPLLSTSRNSKRSLMVFVDLLTLVFSLWAAFALRLSDWWPQDYFADNKLFFLLLPILGVMVFGILGLYSTVLRFLSFRLFWLVALGVTCLVLGAYVFSVLVQLGNMPRSVPVIFGLCAFILTGGSRLLFRAYYYWITTSNLSIQNVLIYGAGSAGSQLVHSLNQSEEYRVKGFIDDNASIVGSNLAGIKVYPTKALKDLIEANNIDAVLMAIPNASREQRRSVLQLLAQFPVHVQSIPSMSEIISGEQIEKLKEVELDDLLGRDVVVPDAQLMSKCILNKSVCVTGAGGSIGSELSRQCIENGAQRLVLFEQSEYALYSIEKELSDKIIKSGVQCDLIPILGSVTNKEQMCHVFRDYQIDTVYHAAAYKHVPLVEANGFAGIYNNAFGTRSAAIAATLASVERFILISTDKAVRPTNIMGATKRIAEQVLQDLADRKGHNTIFSMVRFGNVLGSSGSVVPLFKKQIEQGGPVTVTHPNITRFFMTIPEATSLVIQAGSMANGGEVFLLDMGQPIRIVDMAESMIHLSGLEVKSVDNPDGDIEIQFTGLRPGEKLYEELLIDDAVFETSHPKILAANEKKLPTDALETLFENIEKAANEADVDELKKLLISAVSGYRPDAESIAKKSNIVKLPI